MSPREREIERENVRLQETINMLTLERERGVSLRETALANGLAITTHINGDLALRLKQAETLALHDIQLEQFSIQFGEKNKQYQMLEEKNEQLQAQLDLVKAENIDLQSQLDVIKQENIDLQYQLKEFIEKNTQQQKQLDVIEDNNASLQNQLDVIKRKMDREENLLICHGIFVLYKFYFVRTDWPRIAEEISEIENDVEDDICTVAEGDTRLSALRAQYSLDPNTPLSQIKKLSYNRPKFAHPNTGNSVQAQKSLLQSCSTLEFSTFNEDEKAALNFMLSQLSTITLARRR
ncbi:hypothetical protein HDV01_004373 [Terramyces sp. JEL0728]|nr:hypothetical protein HDV01_004373 [Terramyces sp. JEL0728]